MKIKVQNQQNLKNNNEKMVLEIIRANKNEDISQAKIAKLTHMSPTSISRIVENLILKGLVRKDDSIDTDNVGRKGIKLKLVPDSIITIGVSIDSDNLWVCVMDFFDRILVTKTLELQDRSYTPKEIIQLIQKMIINIYETTPYTEEKIQAVGISCIGNVDYKKGDIYFAPQFGWNHTEFGKMAQAMLGKTVYMENDMKAAITSVVHQDKKLLSQDVTYLSIGMGVGSAVMFHGEIIRGSDNAFGEVGHVIIHPDGRKCDCGQRGCVQTTLTHNSLIEECQEMGVDISRVEQIFKAYRCQEKWALEFVHKTAADLSILLRNLVYMYNTNYILVGGAMILDYPELLELAQKKLENLIHSNLYSNLKIIPVKTRNNSMAGAAFIAQENCMKNIVESDLENSI